MLLTTKDLTYWYQTGQHKQLLFEDVNLAFDRGTMYSIVGASGSGKTTFLSLIAGLDRPKAGEVLYEAESLNKIGLNRYRNQKVAVVFQAYNLLPYMTVMENIKTAREITHSPVKDKNNYILHMLKKVGIEPELAKQKVPLLSGGQQQRIAIVRAMCCDRDLIVADEPTGNLDENTTRDIIKSFQALAHEENKCVIIVTHEHEVANECDVRLHLQNRCIKKSLRIQYYCELHAPLVLFYFAVKKQG